MGVVHSAEGLIVEQFSYKLGLILTHLAAWNPDQRTQVYTHFHHTGMSDCHTTCTMYMSCDYQHPGF